MRRAYRLFTSMLHDAHGASCGNTVARQTRARWCGQAPALAVTPLQDGSLRRWRENRFGRLSGGAVELLFQQRLQVRQVRYHGQLAADLHHTTDRRLLAGLATGGSIRVELDQAR